MQDFIKVVTGPIKKVALLLFQLPIAGTNLGSIIIIGIIFAAIIGVITHSHSSGRLGNLINRIRNKNNE